MKLLKTNRDFLAYQAQMAIDHNVITDGEPKEFPCFVRVGVISDGNVGNLAFLYYRDIYPLVEAYREYHKPYLKGEL